MPNQAVAQMEDVECRNFREDYGTEDMAVLTLQIIVLIVISNLLHIFLKRMNQPSIISHMAAGLLVGRSGLSHFFPALGKAYRVEDDTHLISMSNIGSAIFMFLVGLEMDLQFLKRSFRAAFLFNLGSIVTCTVIAAIFGPTMYGAIDITCGRPFFVFILILALFNSASPVLIRMMAELKVSMSEVARVGVAASLINDFACYVMIAVMVLFPAPGVEVPLEWRFFAACAALLLFTLAIGLMRKFVEMVNQKSNARRVIRDDLLWFLLMAVLTTTLWGEYLGYPSMMGAFIIGLAFPKDGPSIRTITSKLTFVVNNFILPIYFGYAGVQTDLYSLANREVWITVATFVAMGTIGKVVSTLVVAKHLKMMVKEGLVLGLLLNVKGHVQLTLILLGSVYMQWNYNIHQAQLISMMLSTIFVGPAAAWIVHRERHTMKYQSVGLEWLDLDKELRILACVHSPQDLPTVLDLIQISSGIDRTPLAPYLMHLIEFTGSMTASMLYNQINEDDDLDNGGQNARQINASVDAFRKETGIKLHQLTAISSYTTMHRDTRNGAQDIRAAMVIVPYHRKQRFDGKMGAGNSSVREFNMNLLHSAPCTVGILVDRGLGSSRSGAAGGMASSTQLGDVSSEESLYQIVVLFLGGPDDREAVAYGTRLAMHPNVSITLVRFLPAIWNNIRRVQESSRSSSGYWNSKVSMDFASSGDSDEEFMADVHNRFVSTGMITYVEKAVHNSAEIVTALVSMERIYSLFVVGRQRQGPTAQLTSGMSEWQECEELGSIGDLLASSDFATSGSVLVVQQHDAFKKSIDASLKQFEEGELDDEFQV